MLVVDQDLDGNTDLLYTSDENGPARVTYARPSGAAPVAAEKPMDTTDGATVRAEILEGMMRWIDKALEDAYTDGAHSDTSFLAGLGGTQCAGDDDTACRPQPDRGMINHKGEVVTDLPTHYDQVTHPSAYDFELSDGTAPTPEAGKHTGYLPMQGDPTGVATSAAANDPQATRGQCRAPSETAIPVHVSMQIDFPTVPCEPPPTGTSYPNCILPEPLAASRNLIPLAGGGTLPLCATTVTRSDVRRSGQFWMASSSCAARISGGEPDATCGQSTRRPAARNFASMRKKYDHGGTRRLATMPPQPMSWAIIAIFSMLLPCP